MELATAIKPFCFTHLFTKMHAQKAVYLDPDIKVYRKLVDLEMAFNDGADAIVTPHRLAPGNKNQEPSDLHILQTGTQNLGFLALRSCEEVDHYLEWWSDQLQEHCIVDFSAGLFVDQKFAEFLPSFVDRSHILRDPTYNVAYWNIDQRPIANVNHDFTIHERPISFFHFSGVLLGNHKRLSKHRPSFVVSANSAIEALLKDYEQSLKDNNPDYWSRMPYELDIKVGDQNIPTFLKRSAASFKYRDNPNLFWSYWNEPSKIVDNEDGLKFTRLMTALYEERDDLQETFPIGTKAGRRGFHNWFVRFAKKEYELPECAIAPALLNDSTYKRFHRRFNMFLSRFIRR